MNEFKNVSSLTLGIRFSRSFRIPDVAGEILDIILRDPDTPFGTAMFPNIQEGSARERILHNRENDKTYLKINTDDFILKIPVDKGEFKEKMDWLTGKALPFIENKIFNDIGIKHIQRLGIIYEYEFDNLKLSPLINTLTDGALKNAQNISVTFSNKNSEKMKKAIYKDQNSYYNTIFSFLNKSDIKVARIDYQHYLNPHVEDLRDAKLSNFLTSSVEEIKETAPGWFLGLNTS